MSESTKGKTSNKGSKKKEVPAVQSPAEVEMKASGAGALMMQQLFCCCLRAFLSHCRTSPHRKPLELGI